MKLEVGPIVPIQESPSPLAVQRFADYMLARAKRIEPVITQSQFRVAAQLEQLLLGIRQGSIRNGQDHKDIGFVPNMAQLHLLGKGRRNSFEVKITQDVGEAQPLVIAQTLVRLVPESGSAETPFFTESERLEIYQAVVQLFAEIYNQPQRYYGTKRM